MESSKPSPKAHPDPRWIRFAPFAILACALTVRLAFLWGSPDRTWPHSVLYEGDAPLWVRYSEAIRANQPFEFDLPIHAPGMAWLLVLLSPGAAPSSFLLQKCLFAAMGSFNCVLAWVLARRAFGRIAGLATGLLCAMNFGLAIQSCTLNNDTPYALLLLLSLVLVRRATRPAHLGWTVLWAALNAAAALLRPEHILVFAILLLYSFRHSPGADGSTTAPPPRKPSRPLAAVLAIFVFVLIPIPWSLTSYQAITRYNTVEPAPLDFDRLSIPWTPEARDEIAAMPAFTRIGVARLLSNQARQRGLAEVTRNFIQKWFTEEVGALPRPLNPITFISNQGPLAFALANNSSADGGFSTRLLDVALGAPPSKDAVSTNDFNFADPRHLRLFEDGYFVGFQFIYLNPGSALKLAGRKLSNFLSGLSTGFTLWNLPLGVSGLRRPVDQLASDLGETKLWSSLLLLFGMMGVLSALRSRKGGSLLVVILGKLLITLAFFGYARQGVATLPLLYPFVALGLLTTFRAIAPPRLSEINPRRAGRIALGGLAALLITQLVIGYRGWSYDISGIAEPAPRWGQGAFESHQLLEIQRLPANPALQPKPPAS